MRAWTLFACVLLPLSAQAVEPSVDGGVIDTSQTGVAAMRAFKSLDADIDGALSAAELSVRGAPERVFAIIDRDSDGVLTQAEFGARGNSARAVRFKAMDADKDGFLKAAEFRLDEATIAALGGTPMSMADLRPGWPRPTPPMASSPPPPPPPAVAARPQPDCLFMYGNNSMVPQPCR